LECILPGGELDITNGYSLDPSIDFSVEGLSRELNPNETGPEDLNNKIMTLEYCKLNIIRRSIDYTDSYGPCS